jgi:hypothetical protein
MEESKVVACDHTFDKNEAIDFELLECESVEATTNILGMAGGSIMEGAYFVYRF